MDLGSYYDVHRVHSANSGRFPRLRKIIGPMAVRTIVLWRHGSNLARPVIIHDIIHSVDFLRSRRMENAPTSIKVLLRPTPSQADEPSNLLGSLSSTTRHRCTMS